VVDTTRKNNPDHACPSRYSNRPNLLCHHDDIPQSEQAIFHRITTSDTPPAPQGPPSATKDPRGHLQRRAAWQFEVKRNCRLGPTLRTVKTMGKTMDKVVVLVK